MRGSKKSKSLAEKLGGFFTNLFLILSVVFCAVVALGVLQSKVTGTAFSIFGYRPVYALSGSMEPTIMTNSISLTKQVTNPDEVQVGDIVAFSVTENSGKEIEVVHRFIDITDDGSVITQGDNNNAPDSFSLTRNDIQAKVVATWNGFATIVKFFNSKYGIPILIAFAIAAALIYYGAKCFLSKEDADIVEVEALVDDGEYIDAEILHDDDNTMKGRD